MPLCDKYEILAEFQRIELIEIGANKIFKALVGAEIQQLKEELSGMEPGENYIKFTIDFTETRARLAQLEDLQNMIDQILADTITNVPKES